MSHGPLGTLSATQISKQRGGRPVLEQVSLTVGPGSRVGVVGPNGIGKSTLLQVLGGLIEPDAGSIRRAPSTLEVGYLPQESDARPGETVRAHLVRRTGIADAERALREADGVGAVGHAGGMARAQVGGELGLERLHLRAEDVAPGARDTVDRLGESIVVRRERRGE